MVNNPTKKNHNSIIVLEDEAVCCSDPDPILNKSSEWVCQNCGRVLGSQLISLERRAYNMDEINKRRRTEPRWRCFGSRTIIGQYRTDFRGKQIIPTNRALFSRLNKIQSSLVNSLERNYWEAKPKLTSLSKKLAIPDFIQETAWKIYKTSAKKKLTMGRSIEGFVTASLYAAIRIYEYPRLLEEVVETALLPIRNVHKSLAHIVHEVLPELGLKYKPVELERLVYRFGNELHLSMKIQQDARRMLFKARKRGMIRTGKDPKGIAAAALYLAARDTEEKRTQTQIAQISRITEVTLRTRAKQILSKTQQAIEKKI